MARKSRKAAKQQPAVEIPLITTKPAVDLIPTAAYGRLSVENGGHETDESLQNQMAILYRFIDDHPELELADSYIDNGYTGTNFERPDFQRLMEDVQTGKIGCIVVKDLSRFGRDYLETGYLLETVLPRLNIRFIAVNDNYDSFREEDQDKITVPIKNIVNAMYAKDQSRKLTVAAEARRKKTNVVPNGRAPYGYVISEDHTKYEVDPDAALYVRAIFQWVRTGVRLDEVAKRLNQMEVPVPSDYRNLKEGKPSHNRKWAYSTVRTILNNPSYVGDVCMGRLRQCMYRAEPVRKTEREEWTIYEDVHEPLVSKPDYQEIKNLAKDEIYYSARSKSYNVKAREKFHDQMTGLVYCAECGRRMNYVLYRNDYSRATEEEIRKGLRSRKNGLGRVEIYSCPPLAGQAKCGGHRINTDLLKMIVMDQLNFQIRTMTDMSQILEKLKKENGGKDPMLSTQRKLKSAEGKLASIGNTIMKFYEDLADGVISTDEYDEIRSGLLAKKDNIEQECADLRKSYNKQLRLLDRFSAIYKDMNGACSGNEFDEDLVKRTVERINVTANGDVDIRFVFSDTVGKTVELLKGEM